MIKAKIKQKVVLGFVTWKLGVSWHKCVLAILLLSWSANRPTDGYDKLTALLAGLSTDQLTATIN